MLSSKDRGAVFRAVFREWVKREYTLDQLEDFAKRELTNKAKKLKGPIERDIGNVSTDEVSKVLQQAIRRAVRETLEELEEQV